MLTLVKKKNESNVFFCFLFFCIVLCNNCKISTCKCFLMLHLLKGIRILGQHESETKLLGVMCHVQCDCVISLWFTSCADNVANLTTCCDRFYTYHSVKPITARHSMVFMSYLRFCRTTVYYVHADMHRVKTITNPLLYTIPFATEFFWQNGYEYLDTNPDFIPLHIWSTKLFSTRMCDLVYLTIVKRVWNKTTNFL